MRPLIVLPTYCEAATLPAVLRGLRAAVPEATVLVVDDASPDGTAERAAAVAAELGCIEVLRRPGKAGLGSAYRDGFERALDEGYDAVVEMDSDGSHDPSVLPSILGALDEADLVIGSRYVEGGSTPEWPAPRRLLSRLGNLYADRLLRLGVADSTSGYRAYRTTALKGLDFPSFRAEGYAFQVELTHEVVRAGGNVAEVPITFTERRYGTSKISLRIVVEAVLLVTSWGVQQRLGRRLRPARDDWGHARPVG